MKKTKFIFSLIFVSMTFFTVSAFDVSKLKTDKNNSLDVVFEKIVKEIDKKTLKQAKQLEIILKKDPSKLKGLANQVKKLEKLAQDAKKLKDFKTVKLCSQLDSCLKTLIKLHQGGKLSQSDLSKLSRYSFIGKDFEQIKKRVANGNRNTPQGQKILKFQRSAKNYLRKAKNAKNAGYKSKVEYYNACAEIKKELALKYAANPKLEAVYKKQLRKLKVKYNQEYAQELAVRYLKRADAMRKQNNISKAEYYEKVSALKKKLSKAYAEKNYKLVKSIKKEYKLLQKKSL